jgi:hypothetical protein
MMRREMDANPVAGQKHVLQKQLFTIIRRKE